MNFKVMEHEISLILFVNLQLQLVFKKMLLDEWIRKLWYIYTMEY